MEFVFFSFSVPGGRFALLPQSITPLGLALNAVVQIIQKNEKHASAQLQ